MVARKLRYDGPIWIDSNGDGCSEKSHCVWVCVASTVPSLPGQPTVCLHQVG